MVHNLVRWSARAPDLALAYSLLRVSLQHGWLDEVNAYRLRLERDGRSATALCGTGSRSASTVRPPASLLDLTAVLRERCSLPAVAAAVDVFSFDCAFSGKIMTLTDAQVSRLTAALNSQLEADRQFAAKTQAASNPTPSATAFEANERCGANAKAVPDSPVSKPPLVTAVPLELNKQLDENVARLDLSRAKECDGQPHPAATAASPPTAVSPPLVPQPFEDRYARGWADAWEFVRPQLHELHRRYILVGTRLASANRWIRWLPIICFLSTLFGFALGWCWGTLVTSRSWNSPQKVEIVPNAAGDRGDKVVH